MLNSFIVLGKKNKDHNVVHNELKCVLCETKQKIPFPFEFFYHSLGEKKSANLNS